MEILRFDPNAPAQAIYMPVEEDDPNEHPSACPVARGTFAQVLASAKMMPAWQLHSVYIQVDNGGWHELAQVACTGDAT